MNYIYDSSPYKEYFSEFTETNPDWKNNYIVYDRDGDKVYQRISQIWSDENTSLTHSFQPVINTKTGDIYTDCRKRKIFAKHLSFVFLRPLYIVGKTAWHLSLVGPAYVEFKKFQTELKKCQKIHNKNQKEVNRNKAKETAFTNLKNSASDILRTPLYGLAMTVASLFTVIVAPFSPNFLYRGRDIVGWLERRMHRVRIMREADIPPFSPCFSPIRNIGGLWKYQKTVKPNDSEKNIQKLVKEQLSNLCKGNVKYRRQHRALFNDCCALYPKNRSYVSASVK